MNKLEPVHIETNENLLTFEDGEDFRFRGDLPNFGHTRSEMIQLYNKIKDKTGGLKITLNES